MVILDIVIQVICFGSGLIGRFKLLQGGINQLLRYKIITLRMITSKIVVTLLTMLVLLVAQNCPQLCTTNCSNGACPSCRINFSINASISSNCSCPTGMFLDGNSSLCFPCPITCLTCSSYSQCTTCIPGFMLSNSFRCIQGALNANGWVSKYVSYQLTGAAILGSYIAIWNNNSFAGLGPQTGSMTGLCSKLPSYNWLGGYNMLGYNNKILKSAFALPPHQWLNVRFQAVLIDKWSANTLLLELGSGGLYNSYITAPQVIWQDTFYSGLRFADFCGNSSIPDNLAVADAWTAHNLSSAVLRIRLNESDSIINTTSNLGQVFFAIRELLIRVGTCGKGCRYCSGPNKCTECILPLTLSGGTCICNNTFGFMTATGCHPNCITGFYFNATASRCLNCEVLVDNCQTCNFTSCFTCSVGYFYYNNGGKEKCVRYCPTNFTQIRNYYNSTTNATLMRDQCVPCPNNCKTCNFNICLFCAQGYLYFKGDCLSTCPQGTYPQQGSCSKCASNCNTCSDSSQTCSSCASGYAATQNGCIPYCFNTTILAIINGNRACNITCSANCSSCYGPGSNQCLICSSGILQDGACTSICNNGYYQTDNQCLSCPLLCITCLNSQNCLTCNSGYYYIYSNGNGKCSRICPPSKFPTVSNTSANSSQCMPCSSGCERCKNENFCMECQDEYYNFNFTCVHDIPQQYYYDINYRHIKPCPLNCLKCNGIVCSKCSSGFYLNQGVCVTDCGPYKYKQLRQIGRNSTRYGFCQWKSPSCQTYDNDSSGSCNQCSQFQPSLVKLADSNNITSCSFACPLFFTQSSSYTCVPCPNNCRRCTQNMQCLQCLYNYVINSQDVVNSSNYMNQTCIHNYCQPPYFSDSVQCQICTPGCSVCQIDGRCLECLSQYQMNYDKGTCYSKYCQVSTQYLVNSTSCQACVAPCQTCISLTMCTSCGTYSNGQLYLYQGSCMTSCPISYFAHKQSGTCRKCNPKCQTCLSFRNCLTCMHQYNLLSFYNQYQAECVAECPIGFYSDTNVCLSCYKDCRSCYGPSEYQCLSCYSNFVLDDSKCVYRCSDGKYEDNYGYCDWCDSSCNDCNGPTQQNCVSCGLNYFISDHACYKDSCPGATYLAHHEQRKCERCQFGCSLCNSPQFCRFCFPGYNLYKGWCYKKCPGNLISAYIRFPYLPGSYQNIEGQVCQSCLSLYSSNCKKCDSNSCTKCDNGYYLYRKNQQIVNGTLLQRCVKTCPLGTYIKSNEVRECVSCQDNCQNCTSYQNCVKCSNNYNLINGYCTNSCPSGTYLTAYQNCSTCATTCLTCVSSTSCTSCAQGYYLYYNASSGGNSCISTCPTTFFADNRSGWCSKCLSTCSACTATNNCIQCLTNFTLTNGICQNQQTNCSSNCQSCNNQSCLKCIQPYLLLVNRTNAVSTCVGTCPNGYYSSIFTCESCNASCTICTNSANNCSKCQLGLYLLGQNCISICPVGYFASNTLQQCQTCPTNCLNCQQSICYACQNGFYLLLGQCYSTCPIGTYASVSISLCYNCSSTCATCSGDQNCTSCVTGYLLYNGGCNQNCPMTTYTSTDALNNTMCLLCVSPCYTCSDQDTCISCIPNYILNGTTCQTGCDTGYYYLTLTIAYDNQDQNFNFSNFTQCYPCDPTCSVCSNSATTCQACNYPFILYGTQCISSCPAGTYLNDVNCVSCPSFCLTCNSSVSCQVCANSTVLSANQCLTTCPAGFYMSNQGNSTQNQYACLPCSTGCQSCTGPSLYQCTICSNNLFLTSYGACVSTCPNGTYANTVSQTCSPCPFSCSACVSTLNCSACIMNYTLTSTYQCKFNFNNCTAANCQYCASNSQSQCSQCLPNYYLLNSTCTTSCPTGTYVQNGQCTACQTNCLVCTSTSCTVCNNSTFYYQGSCISTCPAGTFPSSVGCQTDPCLSYNTDTNDCLQCASPFLLFNKTATINGSNFYLAVCVSTCPAGTIQSGSSCIQCPQGCISCISSSFCTNCSAGSILYQGVCVYSCPIGTYPQNSSCQSCSIPFCSQCTSLSEVQSCKSCTATSGAFLVNGICTLVCPTGTYGDAVAQKCLNCSQNCLVCASLQSCSVCSNAYYLYNSQCISNCPSGTYANGNTCSACSLGCYQCTSGNTCSMCQSSFSLFVDNANSSYCVATCPAGYYSSGIISTSFSNSNQYKCMPCVSPCFTCISATSCTQCISNTSLLGTSCVNSCPAGYFSQTVIVSSVSSTTSSCSICSSTCLTCSGTSTYCLSCPSGYLLDSNNNCVSNCVSSTSYYSQTARTCYNCSLQCYSCYGPGTDNCLSCKPPLQLYSGSCFSTCPYGYFSTASYVCQSCSSSCASCQGTRTNCTLCSTGSYLQIVNGINVCSTSCPSGYFANASSQSCISCNYVCLTCNSNAQCTSCSSGLCLINQTCISSCPIGTAMVTSNNQFICSRCPVNCISCTYILTTQALSCTQCSSSYYLFNGNCSLTCPPGTYQSPTAYTCTNCGLSGCQNCNLNASLMVSCTACQASYYMYNGICVTACPTGTILSGSQCNTQPICQGYQWNGYCLPSCPVGTYPTSTLIVATNSTVLGCANCSIFCTSCISSSTCLSCANNTYLYSTTSASTTQSTCVTTCPSNYLILNNICQQCPSPCLSCQRSSTGVGCVTCLPGYYQLGSSCYTTCPNGYYQSGNKCSLCSAVCATCSINSTNCLTCKNINSNAPSCSVTNVNCTNSQYQSSNTTCSNCNSACLTCYGGSNYECLSCFNASAILISGSCITSCPSGTIRSNSSCIACPSNCINCTLSGTSLTCSSCASPFILATINGSSSCVSSCSSLNSGTQSYVQANGQCLLCNISGCVLCNYVNNQFQCVSCLNTTYLYNQQCLTACPTGTRPSLNPNACISCSQNCLSCSNTTCTSCKIGFYLLNGQCVNSCGSGYYFINSTCYKCAAPNCVNCTSTSCQSCQQPYLLSNSGQCTNCISGYYSVSGVCQICSSPCLTCTSSSTTCTSCSSGYLIANSSTCVANCPTGYYATTARTCLACTISNCQTCTSSSCTSCITGYVLVVQGGQKTCQNSCPAAMYLSTTANSCINCSTSCTSCTSSTSCSTCASPSVLYQGYCLSSCPSGYAKVNQTCVACQSSCKTCSSTSNCTSCNAGYTLINGTCTIPINNCQNGYFLNALNSCSQCFTTCQTCSSGNANNCLTCFNGYTLINGACTQVCDSNSFYNTNNSTCQLCSSLFVNCVRCTNSSCLSCATNYTALNGNCTQSCPSGTYPSNGICNSCSSFCLTCISSSSCTKCLNSSILLINGQCYTSCPDQTYFSNSTCKSCYQTCLTCSGTSSNCSACITPYNLYNNSCIAVCPNSTYSSNYVCAQCSTNCLLCTSGSTCTQCSSSLYLINGTCRSSCPSGYFIDTLSQRCIQCVSPCLVCSSRSTCSSCQSPSTLSNGMCINSNCTAGYYDYSTRTCTNCTINHCGYCSNSSCSNCALGYYSIYMNGVLTYCQPGCIAGTFVDSTTMNCSSCFTNCFSCLSNYWCNICNSGFYVLSVAGALANECVTFCPLGYYQNNTIYICSPCNNNCVSCVNGYDCLVCSSYYYLFNSNGTKTCINNCPNMYYTPTNIDGTGQCGACGLNCFACDDAVSCKQCISSSDVIVNGVCTPYNCVHCFTCYSNNNTCGQCIAGYYIFNNACYGSCPDGYFPNNSTGRCSSCVSNCLLCQNANSCMLCISGYVFANGTGCEHAGLLKFGVLGNMSGFTSNITKIMAIVYVSTSSGPIAFGAIGSTYGPMQFCQFMYLLQGSSGGNDQMNNFLNSLSAVSYTTNSGTNERDDDDDDNDNDDDDDHSKRSKYKQTHRLLTAINYRASFLQTNLPIFIIMISFIAAYIFVLVLQRYNNSCCMSCPTLQKYLVYTCDFMQKRFKFIYVDSVMWISYLPFLYFAILQLQSGGFSSGIDTFSSLLAIAIIIVYPLYPIFILRKLFDRDSNPALDLMNYKAITLKQPERVDQEKSMCADYTCCSDPPQTSMIEMSLSPYIDKVVRPIYNEFDPDYSQFRYFKIQHWRLAYAPIKYVRKFIYVLIVALCTDPIATLSLLVAVTAIYIIYLIALRPKEKLYLVLEILLESVLLFFIIFMLVYVSEGGGSVSQLSIITHAIGFLIANSALAIAIILNIMAYYTIFCCVVDLIKNLRARAIEDDEKMKHFEQIIDDKQKIDYKDKDKEDIEIRKSLRKGDDEMTVENNDEEHYVPYDLDEKEFNVRSSMINKKKTFEDEQPDVDFSNLKSTKNPKARHSRHKKQQKLEQQSHTSQQMGQSKISEEHDISSGLLKDKNSKYKRQVNKDDVNVERGQIRKPTDNFRKKRHPKDSIPQEQQSLDVLRPEAKIQKQPINEFFADIQTHDRMTPSKNQDYLIDPNFVDKQAKRRGDRKNSKSNEIQEPYMRERQGKNKQSKPSDINEANTYDRQGKRKNLKQNEKDLPSGNIVERERRKKQNAFEFDPTEPVNANTYDRQGRKKGGLGDQRDNEGKMYNREKSKQPQGGNMVERQRKKKQKAFEFEDPTEPFNANTYDRQGKKKGGLENERDLEGKMYNREKGKDSLNEANMYERKNENKNINRQNDKQLQGGNMVERDRKKKQNPFGQFEQIFAYQGNSKPIKEAQMEERAQRQKNTLSGEKLLSGFIVDEADTVQRKNQAKKPENKHYKGSDEEVDVNEGQAVQVKNKFKRNVKQSEKNIPEGDINAYGKDIKTKKMEKIQSTKQFAEDTLEQAKYKERQGRQMQKMKSLNEKEESRDIQEVSGYNRQKRIAEKKKKQAEQKIQNPNLLSPSPVKPSKNKPNIYDDIGEDLTESLEFKEQKKIERKPKGPNVDDNFEEENMAKMAKNKAEKMKKEKDNRMQVSQNLEESYEDVVRKNKQHTFKQNMANKSNLLQIGDNDQFQEVTYSRPESKIQRPKSRSKDMGLGVNSRVGSEASDNESRDIRRQRHSAIQRQRKKGTLNVNESQSGDDNEVGGDSRRVSRIVKQKSKAVKGVLNIDDKSENEDIQHVQL